MFSTKELTVGPHSWTPILMQRITHTHTKQLHAETYGDRMEVRRREREREKPTVPRTVLGHGHSLRSLMTTLGSSGYGYSLGSLMTTLGSSCYGYSLGSLMTILGCRVGEGRRGGKTTLSTVLALVTDSGHDDYTGVG